MTRMRVNREHTYSGDQGWNTTRRGWNNSKLQHTQKGSDPEPRSDLAERKYLIHKHWTADRIFVHLICWATNTWRPCLGEPHTFDPNLPLRWGLMANTDDVLVVQIAHILHWKCISLHIKQYFNFFLKHSVFKQPVLVWSGGGFV